MAQKYCKLVSTMYLIQSDITNSNLAIIDCGNTQPSTYNHSTHFSPMGLGHCRQSVCCEMHSVQLGLGSESYNQEVYFLNYGFSLALFVGELSKQNRLIYGYSYIYYVACYFLFLIMKYRHLRYQQKKKTHYDDAEKKTLDILTKNNKKERGKTKINRNWRGGVSHKFHC